MVKTATRTKTPTAPETAEPAKPRRRRTPEQMIADKQAEIAEIEARAARRAAKKSPEGSAFVAARSAIKRALKAAREATDDPMAEALENAYGQLEAYAEGAGLVARR